MVAHTEGLGNSRPHCERRDGSAAHTGGCLVTDDTSLEAALLAIDILATFSRKWCRLLATIVRVTCIEHAPDWQPTTEDERAVADQLVRRGVLEHVPTSDVSYCLTVPGRQALWIVVIADLEQVR
jgi:hypothetical protein